MRRLLRVVLFLGLILVGAELLLVGHYEDARQRIPLALMLLGMASLVWQTSTGSQASLRCFQATMVLFLLAAPVGMALHYRGNLEFQLEIDASQSRWELFKKVVRAKAPPPLAPGAMAQIGLIGLIYAYRYPGADAPGDSPKERSFT